MTPPQIDLTDPRAVCAEVFDDDRWIKDEFAKHLSTEILRFAETIAESFRLFPRLDKMSAEGDEQAAFCAGFVFGVFDDLMVSMKLLVAGKMVASGNLMRQAIEGVAIAILCAAREPVFVQKRKKMEKVSYWRKVKALDPVARAHLALSVVESNREQLGVSVGGLERLKVARTRYHSFSHPSLIGMASRIGMGEAGPIYIGGTFDEAWLLAYRVEISERTGLCGVLPKLIEGLIQRLGNP